MTTLYEIEQSILDCIDMETGEIIDKQRLDELNLDKERKLENVALWVKNLNSDIEDYKAEKQIFEKKIKATNDKIEWLKNYLTNSLNGSKFKTARVSVSYRNSERVVVEDATQLPATFISFEPKIDKRSLKEALKNGEELAGAHLEQCSNIQIR